jgi:hypothetical protein
VIWKEREAVMKIRYQTMYRMIMILLAAAAAPLLRDLARIAPLVISLPEPEPPFTPPSK